MTKEQIIEQLKKDEEFSDCTLEELEEVAEMELKSGNIKRYEQAQEKKVKKPREVKIDQEKVSLLKQIAESVDFLNLDMVVNPQKEIAFVFNGSKYSLTLTKHRPPKK